jgi:hypothetical protein
MMAPRDFNEDGAAGAFGGNGGSPASGSSGPFTPQSFGAATQAGNPMTGIPDDLANRPGELNGPGLAGVDRSKAPSLINPASLGSSFHGAWNGGYGIDGGSSSSSGSSFYGPPVQHFGFADGGAVPDDSGDQSGGDDLISLALASVDGALDYGRNKYGLSGGAADDGSSQQASAIPIAPGTQSESGSRERPAPGPLPPTSNPFGRRIIRPLGAAQSNTQTAALMPMIPGTQSESGIPPQRPQPRPQQGAIPDDQDEEAA